MSFAGTSAGTPTSQLALQRKTSLNCLARTALNIITIICAWLPARTLLNCSFAADAPIHAMMQPAESPIENEGVNF
jgi:hypothetical protein